MDDKLLRWQEKYEKAKSAYGTVIDRIDERDALYDGTRSITKNPNSSSATTASKEASHVRNIVFELIESQVNSSIPVPKVETTNPQNLDLAREIENSLMSDLQRLPMESINDEQERTTPVQGGSPMLLEWDNSITTHNTVGDLSVTVIHPRNFIPQPGVYDIQKSDYMFVRTERTKEYIKNRYGVDVEDESNAEQGIDSAQTDGVNAESNNDEKITQVMCYYRNKDGGIGLYSWVNDVVVEDLEDYQARIIKGKKVELETLSEDIIGMVPVPQPDGSVAMGMGVKVPVGTQIPYYKPNRYPVILRKNVTKYGQFLGGSDVDVIQDQQELIKKLGTKLNEKLLTSGSIITLPRGLKIRIDESECKRVDVDNVEQAKMVGAHNLVPNPSYDIQVMEVCYQHGKSTLGVTDSLQGKPDPTAPSGVAKQLQIAQSNGRLESKRVMKSAAFEELFRLMFQFKLAYTDEPRPYSAEGSTGDKEYGAFSRYDFLKKDAAGEWYYEDDFLFTTDPAGSLSQNREAMWNKTTETLQYGGFGDPADPQTLLLYWSLMDKMNYPHAKTIKAKVEERIQQQAMAEQAMMQQQMIPQVPQEQVMPTDLDAEIAGL